MVNKEIQIVAFNNPYPPDFGGAIDVFYKIKALSELGVKIYLHIYYDERSDISGLVPLCETINLYKRNKFFTKHISTIPYIVNTRISETLIDNLNKNDAPILFESLRTTGAFCNNKFKQKTAVRCHNIEHDYSLGLFKSENNWFKKLAFFVDSYKLKYFENILNQTDVLFPISYYEHSYFSRKFKSKSVYLPVFQRDEKVVGKKGKGEYALYHGDLSISDNIKSALFVISVFKDLKFPLIIASSTDVKKVIQEINKYENISFQLIKQEHQLENLIREAHINTLYSFQRSGTKLKVFNALFNGRFCLLNKNMVDDPDVLKVCKVAENKLEYKMEVEKLIDTEFEITQKRIDALHKYSLKKNAEIIIKEML